MQSPFLSYFPSGSDCISHIFFFNYDCGQYKCDRLLVTIHTYVTYGFTLKQSIKISPKFNEKSNNCVYIYFDTLRSVGGYIKLVVSIRTR